MRKILANKNSWFSKLKEHNYNLMFSWSCHCQCTFASFECTFASFESSSAIIEGKIFYNVNPKIIYILYLNN